MAGIGGLEPPSDGIKNRCLNQLGYIPKKGLIQPQIVHYNKLDFLTFLRSKYKNV